MKLLFASLIAASALLGGCVVVPYDGGYYGGYYGPYNGPYYGPYMYRGHGHYGHHGEDDD